MNANGIPMMISGKLFYECLFITLITFVKKKSLTNIFLLYILVKVNVKRKHFTRGDAYGKDGKTGFII